MHQGQENLAVQHYAKAIEHIDDLNLLKSATLLAYKQKDYATAAQVAEKWIQVEPNNDVLKQRLAVIYLSTHKVDKALTIIEGLSNHRQNMLFEEISKYGLLSADNDTLTIVAKLATQFPDQYEAQVLYAKSALHVNQYEVAEQLGSKLIEMDATNTKGYKIKAYALREQDRIVESIEILKQGIEIKAEDIQMRKNYAQALIEGQQYQQAYDATLELYALDQDNPEVLQMLGVAAMSVGKTDDAMQYFRALAAFPGLNLRSRFFQAHVWYKQEDYEQAIQLLTQIPAEAGTLFEEAQLLLVRIYQQQNKYKTAIKQLQQARQANTDSNIDINLYLAEGELLMSREDYSEAYVLYSDAIEAHAEVTSFRQLRAATASEIGHIDVMESDLQFILARDPNNADALNTFGYCLADKNIRLAEAKSYIQQALKLSPDNPAIIDSMGWVEFRLNHLENAETLIRTARGKINDPVVEGHLVEILRARNQSQEAKQTLYQALEKYPNSKYLKRLDR